MAENNSTLQTTSSDLAFDRADSGVMAAPNNLAADLGLDSKVIEVSAVLAQRFRRDELVCHSRVMTAMKRLRTAQKACYSFPRGNTTVSGPSVALARVLALCWGNLRHGLDILGFDDSTNEVIIRGWAWDLERNEYTSFMDRFKRLVQRKVKDGQWPNGKVKYTTKWVQPDERDLRELCFRRGAILVRNAILSVLPPDLIEDAQEEAVKTVKAKVDADPASQRKLLVAAFEKLGVTIPMIDSFVGSKTWAPTDLVRLGEVYTAMTEENVGRETYFDIAIGLEEKVSRSGPERLKANIGATDPEKELKPASTPSSGGEAVSQSGAKAEFATPRKKADLIKEICVLESRIAKDIEPKTDMLAGREQFAGDKNLNNCKPAALQLYYDALVGQVSPSDDDEGAGSQG